MAETSGQEPQQNGAALAPDGWGQPITPERQAELQAILDAWEAPAADHGARRGPFDGINLRLTGDDVSWLAQQSGRDMLRGAANFHLAGADLRKADLSGAHLEGADLEGADLSEAHLEGARLSGAHLEDTTLFEAHLEGARLNSAMLERADLSEAHLEGARLNSAMLERADLSEAHLEGADLFDAQLEGALFDGAHLEGADLREAKLDMDTDLPDVRLGPGIFRDTLDRLRFRNRNAALGDIKWRGADLTAVPWERMGRLGDERDAGLRDNADAHRAVVRAYRQVAAQLRDQGMAEAADRFAYRAQIRQRGVLLRTFRLPQYLFSWVLAILAGYGYRPGRTFFWYLVTIASFTFMYLQATHGWVPFGLPAPSKLEPLPWYEALILSVSSFHGRGFFQPLQSLGDPIAALAAIEAVIGLFIEISFIATFTQRYFGNR